MSGQNRTIVDPTPDRAEIASSVLLRSVTYPGSVGGSDQVWVSYNPQGQRICPMDQNGSGIRMSTIFGTSGAIGMSILDNIPIVDLALAGAETIDSIQQERLKAERESREEEARLMEELLKDAKEAGEDCNNVE